MIRKERISYANGKSPAKGHYVLYWMQASQRAHYNHALEFAIMKANELGIPPVVYMGITDSYPEANERHYSFMMEGLRETSQALRKRGINLIMRRESPDEGTIALSKGASCIVIDSGYTRIQKEWRARVAENITCPCIEVESDVVVPVVTASPKQEFSAATFRPGIREKLSYFMVPLQEREPLHSSLGMEFESLDPGEPSPIISAMSIDRTVKPVREFRGGYSRAEEILNDFLEHRLEDYASLKNDPSLEHVSHMSPYLHFGQISPLFCALRVKEREGRGPDSFFEELVVRRELSINYVFYNRDYDKLRGIPQWARKTLEEHSADHREILYSLDDLEHARTHDPYWNAAQREMMIRGKMHGYMRMYWGKKLLEWSPSPEEGFDRAIFLNNKYELDGRDPNGYTGVAWCFGLHDRPWKERGIFGKIRYMNDRGLERKFDIGKYVARVNKLKDSSDPGIHQD